MNVIELLMFLIFCSIGLALGYGLNVLIGTVGWIIGTPIGFYMALKLYTLVIRMIDKSGSKGDFG